MSSIYSYYEDPISDESNVAKGTLIYRCKVCIALRPEKKIRHSVSKGVSSNLYKHLKKHEKEYAEFESMSSNLSVSKKRKLTVNANGNIASMFTAAASSCSANAVESASLVLQAVNSIPAGSLPGTPTHKGTLGNQSAWANLGAYTKYGPNSFQQKERYVNFFCRFFG